MNNNLFFNSSQIGNEKDLIGIKNTVEFDNVVA